MIGRGSMLLLYSTVILLRRVCRDVIQDMLCEKLYRVDPEKRVQVVHAWF